jgi:2-polyprenyl-3-methyl-5-hydroxy-6-metoxy-1,4-benzoquinol methylase
MKELSTQQHIQEEEYFFPYHYLNILSPLTDIEYVSYIRIVKEIISKLNCKNILDFGCGDGRFEFEMKDSEVMVEGIDYSQKAIGFAKAFNLQNKKITFICQDLLKKSESRKYDAIVSIETLEHIPPKELKKLIKKFSKLLNKQGRLIITVPSKNVPLFSKHYQHFDEETLDSYFGESFVIDDIIGQYYIGSIQKIFRLINALGRILEIILGKENSLTKRYSAFVWQFFKKYIENAPLNKAKRLIVVFSLKS